MRKRGLVSITNTYFKRDLTINDSYCCTQGRIKKKVLYQNPNDIQREEYNGWVIPPSPHEQSPRLRSRAPLPPSLLQHKSTPLTTTCNNKDDFLSQPLQLYKRQIDQDYKTGLLHNLTPLEVIGSHMHRSSFLYI